ncbi:MAG TPA: FAD-dependent oxidoreductase [Candidatus Dormibacteraeota bacterium]|nr:FAD-dependent oxidoreductase [Candidatus Dormibacteraeota bacterium]
MVELGPGGTGVGAAPSDDVAFPPLTPEQLDRLRALAPAVEADAGDVLVRAGDADYDFILIDAGEVEVVMTAPGAPATVVVRAGPGQFLGELNMLTGQATNFTSRMARSGRLHRIPHARFRRLMAEEPELSDVILRAYMARRETLRTGEAAHSLEILGSRMSAAALSLRNWAARQRLIHTWIDVDTPAGRSLLESLHASVEDLPLAVSPRAVLRRATPGVLAEHLGLSFRSVPGRVYDLVVAGGGPAGLAAAVYGASEGLDTVLLDAVAVGGQAAASSRIENYLGFPSGLSGGELTARALVQATKFGARINSPCAACSLQVGDGHMTLTLNDGTEVATHAVILATGARYRTLDLDRWTDFEGAGIYYAATDLEARNCPGRAVAVVGGANSAGQAALFLAPRFDRVHLVVRGSDLGAGMSQYLVERVVADPRIEVHTGTEVGALHGGASLEEITLLARDGGARTTVPCCGLFCFIGAEPVTGWLEGVALDEEGFVLTGHDLPGGTTLDAFDLLGRRPLPFETSIPGVFAAGDVRHGSMKRVAAAVGEGASAVHSVHQAIGT